MSAEIIQAQYDKLDRIATIFGQQAGETDKLYVRLQSQIATLQDGGWEGVAAGAFFNEMDSKIFPTVQRLTSSLEQSSQVVFEIIRIIQEAEKEASALLQMHGENVWPRSIGTLPGILGAASVWPFMHRVVEGGVYPIPVSGNESGNFWKHIRLENNIWSYDHQSQSGKFDPELNLTVGIEEKYIWGDSKDGIGYVGGKVEAGVRANSEGIMIGAGGEYHTFKGEWDTAFVGNKDYGFTSNFGFSGLGVRGFGGAQFDGDNTQFGGSIGGNLFSVEGGVGANIAGHNVSAVAELGLKKEWGLEIGKETVVRLPFISFGLRFGAGRD